MPGLPILESTESDTIFLISCSPPELHLLRRAMSPDDSSSTGSTEAAPSPMEKVDSEKETLKWYKFYYQVLKTK